MVTFINRLKISPVDNNKDDWELLDIFEVHISDIRPEKIAIKIPKGFITDGASVPRIFWIYLPRFGKYTKAAIVHDYLYKGCGSAYEQFGISGYFSINITRKESDLIFKKIMKVSGVNKVKCWLMYNAVRIFGWFSWRTKNE